jgi:hypothetical protein
MEPFTVAFVTIKDTIAEHARSLQKRIEVGRKRKSMEVEAKKAIGIKNLQSVPDAGSMAHRPMK